MNKYQRLIIFTFFIFSFLAINQASGQTENPAFFINLDKETIAKGYTVSAFEDKIKLSLVPGILSESTPVDVMELREDHALPWKLDKISPIYQFEFRNKAAYDNHKPFYIQLSYEGGTNNYKQVFFYDKNYDTWRPLPTVDYAKEKFVRSLIHLPYARIAVFEYEDVLGTGRASWYAYKNGNFAASPDFPKGSIVRVHNIDNGKWVDVTINDYGPDRGLHPDRVIDLDKVAFQAIADPRQGIINVKIEPQFVPRDELGQIVGVGAKGLTTSPEVTLKAAAVYDEESGDFIWLKNATSSMPLASLSKLVSAQVFLDTKPDLSKRFTYKDNDSKENYRYCDSRIAGLAIDEGEEMTLNDFLHVSVIGSTNNTVETFVRSTGLGRDIFVQRMNDYARSLGASSTHFIEPTGLAPENVSSVKDYAIIASRILASSTLAQISASKEYQITISTNEKGEEKSRTRLIKNTNQLLLQDKFRIVGSKTGYLDEAGYCLFTRVMVSEGKYLTVVTFGAASRTASFSETADLIRYGMKKIN